jgi:predicted DNA-binding transcriptional regulator YafY
MGESKKMVQGSARLLRLLSLFQTRRYWTGADLTEALGVTGRTLRRDVDRLRDLGYPVHASPGCGGGYQLGSGAKLPPLLLDDEEAMAVAISLRTAAAASSVAGLENASVRAMAKLEQVLPARLRSGLAAMLSSILPIAVGQATVDLKTLSAMASACRDNQTLRFEYRARGAETTIRDVEPCRVVHTGRRWYLVAWDVGRAAWRTFRLDRIAGAPFAGRRFAPRNPPDKDLAAWVSRSLAYGPYPYKTKVMLHAAIEEAAARIPPTAGLLEAVDEKTCLLTIGANMPGALGVYIAAFGMDFEVIEPAEMVLQIREVAARMMRATGAESGFDPAVRSGRDASGPV